MTRIPQIDSTALKLVAVGGLIALCLVAGAFAAGVFSDDTAVEPTTMDSGDGTQDTVEPIATEDSHMPATVEVGAEWHIGYSHTDDAYYDLCTVEATVGSSGDETLAFATTPNGTVLDHAQLENESELHTGMDDPEEVVLYSLEAGSDGVTVHGHYNVVKDSPDELSDETYIHAGDCTLEPVDGDVPADAVADRDG